MKEYRRIGDLVDLIDERNKDEKVKTLIGVSIDKCFIKSVANTIGTDLSKYQVIRKNDFACSLMQVSRDGKIPIACLKDYDEAIMSPAYYIFRIKNTEEILPDYMAMWFMRPEFDREASYIAVGGVRGSMPWEDFCDMKLPVPPLNEQQKIVDTYNAITNRIQIKQKINENLEKTAQCLFEKMFPNIIDNGNNRFEEIIDFSNGKSRPEELGSIPVYGGNGIMFYTDKTNAENCIAIGRVGAYCGSTYLCKSKCWISDNAIKAKYKFSDKQFFAYYLLKKANLFERHIGTGQQLLTQGILGMIQLDIPKKEIIEDFNLKCEPIENQLSHNFNEIAKLQNLKQIVTSRISRM